MTLSLTGVNAGLVIVSADDPGMHSSQNEQDNRNYAQVRQDPHARAVGQPGGLRLRGRGLRALRGVRHAGAAAHDHAHLARARAGRCRACPSRCRRASTRGTSPSTSWSRSTRGSVTGSSSSASSGCASAPRRRRSTCSRRAPSDFGIIASGVAYAVRARGVPQGLVPQAGHVAPAAVRQGRASSYEHVSRVAVVEELDPFIEEQVRGLGLPVIGKEAIPADGELDQEIVFRALEPYLAAQAAAAPAPGPAAGAAAREPAAAGADLPVRPPVLCPGCSHRSVFTALRRRKLAPMGDIGCYTLGALPPLLRLDSCLCMGASIGMMAGFNKALGRKAAVAVIGDSTFFHSGVTPLIDAFYNEVEGLRHRPRQPHHGHDRPPGSPRHRACARTAPRARASTSRGCARASACAASPSTPTTTRRSTRPSRPRRKAPGLGVIVALAPCVLIDAREGRRRSWSTTSAATSAASASTSAARRSRPARTPSSITESCTGCGLCVEVCRRGALEPRARAGDAADERHHHRLARRRRRPGHPARRRHPRRDGLAAPASRSRPARSRAWRSAAAACSARCASASTCGRRSRRTPTSSSPPSCSRAIRGLDLLGARGTLVCAVTTRITPGQRAAPRGGVPGRPRRRGRGRAACGSSPSTPRRWPARRAPCAPSTWRCSAPPARCSRSPKTTWQRGLEAAVPAKILEVNQRAFALGRAAVASQEVEP